MGLDGRAFAMLKFRSMRLDARPETGAGLVDQRRRARTRSARCSAARRLDELPQLINVLRGDMSLVGPRPERPVFVETVHADDPAATCSATGCKAGITGWAQVNGLRGDTSIEERHRATTSTTSRTGRCGWT